jgi:glucose-6-phosphate 1-epimerase
MPSDFHDIAHGGKELITTNQSGEPFVTLRNPRFESEADIYLFGATVTRWKTRNSSNVLFLGSRSDLSGKKAIRGGIPVIFPQFGDGPLPAHGFARNRRWRVLKDQNPQARDGDYFTSVTFALSESDETLALWPHRFELHYTVTLAETLTTEATVTNTGATPFQFQFALHSYVQIAAIERVKISGLKDTEYIDKVLKMERFTEREDAISISGETDRVFPSAPDQISVRCGGEQAELLIQKSGMSSAVVWNPWVEKSSRMGDLAPDDFKKFVCVETGQIEPNVTLMPGESWRGIQILASMA